MRCPGCGAEVPDVPELRSGHLYVGAAAGCWASYAELLGRLLGDPSLAEAHMLSVDAYMAQHPGVDERRADQSVWVHLVGLCLSLEHGFGGVASARAKAGVAAPDAVFPWLTPPASLGEVTVLDVLAVHPAESGAAVRRWAESVWGAWSTHQPAIRERAGKFLGTGRKRP